VPFDRRRSRRIRDPGTNAVLDELAAAHLAHARHVARLLKDRARVFVCAEHQDLLIGSDGAEGFGNVVGGENACRRRTVQGRADSGRSRGFRLADVDEFAAFGRDSGPDPRQPG
jgi:hypothetical protein